MSFSAVFMSFNSDIQKRIEVIFVIHIFYQRSKRINEIYKITAHAGIER